MREWQAITDGASLLLWEAERRYYAADLLHCYHDGLEPVLLMAVKVAELPWPTVDTASGYNLIRVGRRGILIALGRHFSLYAKAFKGCYEPLAKRAPDGLQYFPAPTEAGSEALARSVLALLGLEAGERYTANCQVTGEALVGYSLPHLASPGRAA